MVTLLRVLPNGILRFHLRYCFGSPGPRSARLSAPAPTNTAAPEPYCRPAPASRQFVSVAHLDFCAYDRNPTQSALECLHRRLQIFASRRLRSVYQDASPDRVGRSGEQPARPGPAAAPARPARCLTGRPHQPGTPLRHVTRSATVTAVAVMVPMNLCAPDGESPAGASLFSRCRFRAGRHHSGAKRAKRGFPAQTPPRRPQHGHRHREMVHTRKRLRLHRVRSDRGWRS